MDRTLFTKLHSLGLISDASLENIRMRIANQLFSLYWELRAILYIGVLLLSGSIGILIYKNIDSIGHAAILLFIVLISAGCFAYCFKKSPTFSLQKVLPPNSFFDYILLLGCLTFISFVGYLQFQYQVFGNRFGLALFIPLVVLFLTAYYFDNLAILSLAITNLAAWAGIAITPARILADNNFDSSTIIFTGLLLGIVLIATGIFTKQKKIKAHFDFTYTNFGTNISFISCLTAMMHFERSYLLWFVLLAGISYYFYAKAVKEKSFYFLLIMSLYAYVGVSYVIMRFLFYTINGDIGGLAMACLYFIGSAIWLILFLIKMNKKLKAL
ncbi:MAG: DUF2157 domain-containing protein [Ferruginibacter sp.]|nr:DUF2157 domain-containing protein [Ferruginibacter sp.]